MQGDGRHVEIVVVSKEFEGKSAVNRQRMVYKVRGWGWWRSKGRCHRLRHHTTQRRRLAAPSTLSRPLALTPAIPPPPPKCPDA